MKKTPQPPVLAQNVQVQPGHQRRRRVLNGRGPAPLALEARVMFDGATGDAVLAAKAAAEHAAVAQVAEHGVDAGRGGIDALLRAPAAVQPVAEAQRHEIVFIEDNVQDYQQIVAGVKPGVEVVMLDHTKDGLQQMLSALDGHPPLDAIHLVTHGAVGEIELGTNKVSDANLGSYSEQFAQLGRALTQDGDLLMYGCDTASGERGQAFVNRVAGLTGADVAASSDVTGAAVFGGNWTLEVQAGHVETAALAFPDYAGELSVTTVEAISTDNIISGSEATSVTMTGTASNSGQTVQLTITDGTKSANYTAPTNNSAWNSGALDLSSFADGTLTIYTRQSNTAGVTSAQSEKTVTLTKDTKAPTVSVSSSSLTQGGGTFTLSGADTGGTGVQTYEYQADSTSGAWTSTTTMSATLSGLTAGSHTLYVRATDKAGNTTASANYAAYGFTVAGAPVNHAPVAAADAVLASIAEGNTSGPGATVSSLFNSHFSDSDGDTLGGIAIVSYTRNSSMGEWQYNSGSGWTTITASASNTAAITFKSTDQLRFVPASGYTGGAPALAVRLIDSKATVTTNGSADTSGAGGSSDYSAATINLNTAVKPVFSLASADSKFVTLLSGSGYDPVNDTQSHAADTDLVGNASTPLLIGGYDSTTGDLYYRVRIGNPTLSKGVPTFTGVVLLGVDVDNDGKLDVFIAVDGRNNGMGVATFAPGSDLNVSPSTTSLTAEQAIGANAKTSYTYTLTGGDVGADGKPDAYLTFTLPFSVLQARLAGLNKTVTTSTTMGYVLLTATQNNAINGDIGGIGSFSKAQGAMTWKDLGLLKPVNLVAPTLAGIGGNYQYVEGATGVVLAPSASFSDFDSTNFSGGKLEVTISGNAESGKDLLSLSGSGVTLNGSTVSVSGNQVGTYTFSGNVLTVNFTGANVTADQVNAVTRAVMFSNSSQAPSSLNRTVQFKVTDPETHASDPTLSAVTVLVQPVNNAPSISAGASLTRTVTSGSTYAVGTATTSDAVILGRGANSNLSVADVDAASGTVTVTLGVDPGIFELYNGTTLVNGSATIDGVTFAGSRTGSLVMTGTLANINAILAGANASAFKVLYQPGMNPASAATLSLVVNDQGNTGSGGPQSASNANVGTITIATPQTTGTLSGAVTEDNAVVGGNLTASGTLTNSISAASFTGNTLGSTSALGTLAYSGGTWTYTVANSTAAVQALVYGQSIQETFQVTTAGGTVYVHVTINGTNDAPTLSVTNGSSGFTEGGSATTLFSSATATLGGSGASAEGGQAISAMKMDVSGVFDGDQIVIDGSRLFLDQSSSGTLTASGYKVDVIYAGGAATLTISTGQAASSDIQALITGLAYQSSNRNPTNFGTDTSRTFTIRSLSDTGGTQLGGSNQATLSLSRTVTVTAVNDAPVLNVAPVTVNQNSSIVLTNAYLLANDPDTSDASLAYTVTGLPGKGTVKVNGVAATQFNQQDITDGKVTYTANASGSDQTDAFTVAVSDGTTSVSKSVDVSIITANYAPTSADNAVSTAEDTPYVLSVADFAFSDFNTGDSMSKVELFTLPGAGKLQANVNGTWTDVASANTLVSAADIAAGNLRFVPVADAFASPYTSFTFKVDDQSGAASGESQMTVSVTPVNDKPVAADASVSTNEDVALAGKLPVATDVDHDAVTYAKTSDPLHGTVTIGADGAYTYTPSQNFNGSDSFAYTVSDGKGGTNQYTVTVSVVPVNDLPTGANGSAATDEDVPLNGTLPVATDVDHDQIIYTKATDPLHGNVTVNADGTFTYTPAANYNGSDSFTYKIDDQKGGTNTYTLTLTVRPVNDLPVAANGAIATSQGTAASGNLPTATDADNDPVTYAAGSLPSHGAVVVNANGSYTYTPAAGFNGNDSFTYTVSDGQGGTNTYTMSVTVGAGNHAPTAADVQANATEDTTLSSQLPSATDSDGDTVAYALAGAAAHGTAMVNADGSYTYAPNANFYGSDSFTYTVSDGKGGNNTYRVDVTVAAEQDAPVDANQAVVTAEDTSATFTLPAATDVDGDTLSYSAATGPQHGTLTLNSDGSYTYAPSKNFNGTDTATFAISDGHGGTATYTVNLTVTPVQDAPVDANQSVTTAEDTSASFTLPAGTDADGDTLVYTAATGPQHGTLTLNNDGSYTYAPSKDYNGTDSATFTIADGHGGTATYTVSLAVTPVNDAPLAANTVISTDEGTSVSDSLPAATDADNDQVTYTKATDPANGTVSVSASGSYTYAPSANFSGNDSFTYTVSDGNGGSNTYTVSVAVGAVNHAPVSAAMSAATNEDTVLSGFLPTATDVDHDTVTYAKATDAVKGTVTVGANGAYTYTPNANFAGTDSFTFTVSDGKGGTSTYQATITVATVNDAPVAASTSVTTAEDSALSATLPAATDVENDPVTYAKASDPANGRVTVNADGTYTYTPHENFNGADSFSYTVSDNHGGSATYTVSVTVTPVNDAPLAAPLTVTTNEDTQATGTLPAATDADNDTVTYSKSGDPANGAVSIDAGGAYTYTPSANFNGTDSFSYAISDGKGGTTSYTVTVHVTPVNDAPVAADATVSTQQGAPVSGSLPAASDADHDAIGYAKVADPSHGTVSVAADGSFTYSPAAGFNGTDSFTYQVSDGHGGSNAYTVTVGVGAFNHAPVAANATLTTSEDTQASGALPSASDADGDHVSYTKSAGPSHGSVAIGTDGSYTYTPSANFNGSDSFTYSVSDGKGGSNSYTVSVTVDPVNDAPVAANTSIATSEDQARSGSLPSATDVDGDTVAYGKGTDPAHGTVVVNADGSYLYTPAAGYSGNDSFGYTVSDGNGGSNAYTVQVSVGAINHAPTATNATASTTEGQALSASLPAATDVDGDAVTYLKDSDPAHGSVVVGADGSYTYTPAANFSGSDSFSYKVSDGKGASNSYTVSVSVGAINHSPSGSGLDITTREDTPVSATLPVAGDTDGDPLSYAAGNGASHGSVTIHQDGSYTYAPAANYHGADSFTYVVSDGHGGSASYTVNVTVQAVNDAPVASGASLRTLEETALQGNVPAAHDIDGDALSYAIGSGPQHGAVSFSADGSFVYKPDANFNGSDSFTYTVSDGHGGSGTATIGITVAPVNDAPVAHGGASATGTVGESMTAVAVPSFTDVDSPTITYTATMADGSALPAWIGFDPATRSFSGTPPVGSAGTYAIRLTGSDGQLSDSVAVVITVQNPPAPKQSVSISAMSKDTGVSATDFITADGSANRTVTGMLSAALGKNEVVQVSFDGGASWSTAAASGTSWSATDGGAHSGNWTIAARVTNTVANLSGASDSRGVVLDTTPPAVPSVDSQTTSSTTPVLGGGAQVADGETLRIGVNGGTYDVTAQGGRWTLDLGAVSAAPLVPGQSYDVTATIADPAGNSRSAGGTVSVSVPVVQKPVQQPETAPAATTVPPEASTSPVASPSTGTGSSTGTSVSPATGNAWGGSTPSTPGTSSAPSLPTTISVAPSSPAVPSNPAAPEASSDVLAAPGSLVGSDSLHLVTGQGTRSFDSSVELQITRSAELSDVYTRSEGFRTVVAKAQEPALVLFQGVPDQYVESGTHLSLTVPADAFAHTQPKAVVRLAAQLSDGRPLPAWVSFNGQTGQFRGDAPPGMRGELRIKIIARDMDGREATALFRVNVGEGRVAGEAVKTPAGKPGLSQQLRAAGQRAPVAVPQPQT